MIHFIVVQLVYLLVLCVTTPHIYADMIHFIPRFLSLFRHALQEIIPACACMRNHSLVPAVTVENDPIRSRAASGVNLEAAQNGELVIRARVGEIEAFVIIVYMRILVLADGLVLGIVVAALLDCVVDIGLIVARAAAFIDALPLRDDQREASLDGVKNVQWREDRLW